MGTLAQVKVANVAEIMEMPQIQGWRQDVPDLYKCLWDICVEENLFDGEEILIFLAKISDKNSPEVWDAFLKHRERHMKDTEADAFFDFVWTCIYKGFPV